MKNNIDIRPVTPNDYPALLEIENTIWTKENSPVLHHYDSVEEYQAKNENQTIFVALYHQKVAGFISIHFPTPLAAHCKQWMLAIGIKKEYQSLGIGNQLLTFIKHEAKKQSIHKISLRVMGTNVDAIAFYKKNGFTQEALFKDEFYIDGRFLDDYQFAYFLNH